MRGFQRNKKLCLKKEEVVMEYATGDCVITITDGREVAGQEWRSKNPGILFRNLREFSGFVQCVSHVDSRQSATYDRNGIVGEIT